MAQKTLEKNAFLTYFDIYKDKFFKIVILNILYFSVLTILLIASFGLSYLLFDVLKLTAYLAPVALLPMIGMGPATAVFIKLCRDFVRREPGFLMAYMKNAFIRNWKQSLIIGIVQYIVIFGLYIAIPFYYSAMNNTEGAVHIFYMVGLGV